MISFSRAALAECAAAFARSGTMTLHLSRPSIESGEPSEIAGFGYSPISIEADNWVAGSDGSVVSGPHVFAFTGEAGMVAGYFLMRGGKLIGTELFASGPMSVQNNGDKIKVTISLNFK